MNSNQLGLRLFRVVEGNRLKNAPRSGGNARPRPKPQRSDVIARDTDTRITSSPPCEAEDDAVNAKVNELRARLRRGDFPELSTVERFVLMLRCDSFNDGTKRCNESQPTLAREIKKADRTVRRIDARLVKLGFLKPTGGGRGLPNNYEPTIPDSTPNISRDQTPDIFDGTPDISSMDPGHSGQGTPDISSTNPGHFEQGPRTFWMSTPDIAMSAKPLNQERTIRNQERERGPLAGAGAAPAPGLAPAHARAIASRSRDQDPSAGKAGAPWPDGFAPDDAMRAFAIEKGIAADRVDLVFEKCRVVSIGNRKLSHDWRARWEGWVIDEVTKYGSAVATRGAAGLTGQLAQARSDKLIRDLQEDERIDRPLSSLAQAALRGQRLSDLEWNTIKAEREELDASDVIEVEAIRPRRIS